MSPITTSVDDGGAVVVSTRETAVKTKNLRRRPGRPWWWLNDRFSANGCRSKGPVEIVSLPEAMDGLVAYYRSVAGEHTDWDEYAPP